jgi:hypothetical protein
MVLNPSARARVEADRESTKLTRSEYGPNVNAGQQGSELFVSAAE